MTAAGFSSAACPIATLSISRPITVTASVHLKLQVNFKDIVLFLCFSSEHQLNPTRFGGRPWVVSLPSNTLHKCGHPGTAAYARPEQVQQDALPKVQSSYSITSSARASTEVGRSRPSAFAVLRLTTNSYFVGTCTGRSAAFSPLRITSGEAVLVNPITSVSDQATSGREVALRVYRRQLVPRCKGNDK